MMRLQMLRCASLRRYRITRSRPQPLKRPRWTSIAARPRSCPSISIQVPEDDASLIRITQLENYSITKLPCPSLLHVPPADLDRSLCCSQLLRTVSRGHLTPFTRQEREIIILPENR